MLTVLSPRGGERVGTVTREPPGVGMGGHAHRGGRRMEQLQSASPCYALLSWASRNTIPAAFVPAPFFQ